MLELLREAKMFARRTSPFVDLPRMRNAVWLEPRLRAEVSYAEIVAEAKIRLEAGTEYTESIGFMSFLPIGLVHLSEAYLRSGDLANARVTAERAEELTSEYGQHAYHARALRMLAEIVVTQNSRWTWPPPVIANR